jgi:hypothetical protein
VGGEEERDGSTSCQYNSPAFPYFFHISLSRFFFLLTIHHYKIFGRREITKEEMASRGPLSAKWGRREDDDDESRNRRKLEKRKEPVTKDTDEESFFDDTKFVIDLLRTPLESLKMLA